MYGYSFCERLPLLYTVRVNAILTSSNAAMCSVPQPPITGVVNSVNGEVLNGDQLAGAVVEYHCDEGLLPEGNFTAVCTDRGNGGEWSPNPADEICRPPGEHCI